MSEPFNVQTILNTLPHRYPFLLVDKIVEFEPFNYLTAIKNVTINEPFFTGHFPENPVMPGVLMIEALAQAGALMANLSKSAREGYKYLHFFAGVDNVKFKQVVMPGDQLLLKVTLEAQKKDFWRMQGEIMVADKLVCTASLLSAAKEVKA
jgi:3-hydroxyacyl-[acyl-carrier-protein] dehydratase